MLRTVVFVVLNLLLCGVLFADTIAYYRFEGNLGDSAGGSSGSMLAGNATYSSSMPVTTIPQNNLANTESFSLAANSIVSFNYSFPFNTPGEATLEFWIRPTQSVHEQDVFWTTTVGGDANRFNVFLGNNISGGSTFNFDYREPNGTLHPLFNSQQPGGITIPYALPLNEWTFVAVTRTGNTYKTYFNNSQSAAATAIDTNPNLPTSEGWTLNGRAITSPGYGAFAGQVDEVRLSSTALSPSQFLANSVPEPSTFVLLVIAAIGLFASRRRRLTA
jgi:hypothetical protein